MHEIINVNIRNEDGKLLVSSRDIAAGLEKEHKHVLSKIREVLNGSEFCPVEYTDEKGESRPEYLLDKNAFILLVMNYTGYNDFKRAYIKRFDEMEKQLSFNVPKTFPDVWRPKLSKKSSCKSSAMRRYAPRLGYPTKRQQQR